MAKTFGTGSECLLVVHDIVFCLQEQLPRKDSGRAGRHLNRGCDAVVVREELRFKTAKQDEIITSPIEFWARVSDFWTSLSTPTHASGGSNSLSSR